ncbi:MAG: alpha/beta hydrolase family protein [Croceibacterium sp.]
MLKVGRVAYALIALWPVHALADETVTDLAQKFGARESVRSVSLSPQGDKAVAVFAQPENGETAAVIDFASGATKPIIRSGGKGDNLADCTFVTASQIVCTALIKKGSGRDVDRFSRLLVVSDDGSNVRQLTAPSSSSAFYESRYGGGLIDFEAPKDPNAVLLQTWVAEEQSTGSLRAAKRNGLAVEEVNLDTLQRKTLEPPRNTANGFLSDGQGHVRIMQLTRETATGYASNTDVFMARSAPGAAWERFSTVVSQPSGLTEGFIPVAIDPQANVAYGLDSKNGFTGIFKKALDAGGAETEVASNPTADVDNIITIGRKQRIVGVSFATERRTEIYFDRELNNLRAALGKALPNDPIISFVGASEDETKLLLYAGSDTDPGTFWVFDKQTKKLASLMPGRPELAGITMGKKTPVTYTAADGTRIPAYLTLPPMSDGKNLPAIVMPHGGPASRDEWGFDWLAEFFAVRGFAVLQPEFRGSSGFGNAWFEKNGFQSWQKAIGDVDDAGRWLLSQGIAAPGKLAIVGWSYGGYAALQSQVLDPKLYKAVVAIAPVTDLDMLRGESSDEYTHYLTSDFIGHGPHIDEASPARHADRFNSPVLIFHGRDDTTVSIAESETMAGRLRSAGKQVQLVTFDGLDHQLDSTAARSQMLAKSDEFLRASLGIK